MLFANPLGGAVKSPIKTCIIKLMALRNHNHKSKNFRWLTHPVIPRAVLYLALFVATATIALWGLETYYEPNHPSKSAFYYQSLDLSQAIQATYTNKAVTQVKDLGTTNGVKQELVSFNVPKDDLQEFGLMTLPSKAPAGGKYPVIVLCHGYNNPQNYSTLKAYLGDMEFYSQHGYAVIKPDYRGQGFSLTSGTADGAYYSMSYNTDVMSLIAAIKKTSYLDKKDINLWGHSMGGYIALRASVLSSDIKTVVLLSAPVGNIQDSYSSYTPVSDNANSIAQDIRDEQLVTHGTPLSNPTFWDKTSPFDFLSHEKAYVQIHVGSADKIVPPEFSAQLSAALARANKPHAYYVYPGGSHGLGQQRDLIWSRSLAALNAKH